MLLCESDRDMKSDALACKAAPRLPRSALSWQRPRPAITEFYNINLTVLHQVFLYAYIVRRQCHAGIWHLPGTARTSQQPWHTSEQMAPKDRGQQR